MKYNIHLKIIEDQREARSELQKIGVDDDSLPMMAPKMQHFVMKLKDVDVRAANVLKQEMLSKGGEAAVAKWTTSFTRPTTDVLLIGTLKQYQILLKKMRLQPYGMKAMAVELEEVLASLGGNKLISWRCGDAELIVGKRTLIMGILNVTPDSFSESGRYFDRDKAIEHGFVMIEEGADIIDIGGESSRPGAEVITEREESRRVLPVIEAIRERSAIPISIDTQKSEVAAKALAAGANIINDVSALRNDPKIVYLAAEAGVPVILMHMQGTPLIMQQNPEYEDLISEICFFLRKRVEFALEAGIHRENIAVDPGIGFGKTPGNNLEILRRLRELKSIGMPLVLGTSRKSTIGTVLDLPVEERLEGTAATVTSGIVNGADIIRVHDVKEMVRVAGMTDAIIAAGRS